MALDISNSKNLLFLLKFVLLIHSVTITLCINNISNHIFNYEYMYMLYTYNLNIIEYIMGVICNFMYYIFKLYASIIF